MKLGLLQCDHTLESVRQIAGDYEEMFAAWLPAEWRVYDLTRGELPGSLEECDGYVTTGSKASVYDDEPWIHAFVDLTRRMHAARAPYFGVCFGHQMIGHALGGRVAKSPNGWGIGVHRFAVKEPAAWMRPPAESFHLLMSCQDQVLELPPGARILAGNEHCPAGLIQLDSMVGVQGHPEFPAPYAEALLQLRRERIGAERVDRALATLGTAPDAPLLADWARAFFAGA